MTPKLLTYLGYGIYFWSNENGEPIHVHVGKTPHQNATKFWMTSSGGFVLCHNNSRLKEKELKLIHLYICSEVDRIRSEWIRIFGYEKYYI